MAGVTAITKDANKLLYFLIVPYTNLPCRDLAYTELESITVTIIAAVLA